MKQEAINKMQSEMEKFKKNPLAQVLGKYLVGECELDESTAESVAKNEKTLEDLAKHITAYAKKKAVSGMAMIPREQVYAEALKFYGSKAAVTKNAKNVAKPVEGVAKKQLNISKSKSTELEKGQVTFFDLGMGV